MVCERLTSVANLEFLLDRAVLEKALDDGRPFVAHNGHLGTGQDVGTSRRFSRVDALDHVDVGRVFWAPRSCEQGSGRAEQRLLTDGARIEAQAYLTLFQVRQIILDRLQHFCGVAVVLETDRKRGNGTR